jgi:hypothetical protein
MNADELELLIDFKEAKITEFLTVVSKKYKVPVEILQSVYSHCIRYPDIKSMAKDEKCRNIFTKKYEKTDEIKNAFEIISNETKKE